MELKINQNNDHTYVLELSGAMNLNSSSQIKDTVMNAIQNRVELIVMNLHQVTSVNSAGIGALIAVSSTLKKLNCPLVIIAPEGPVMQALELTRLKGYFTFARSLEDALSLSDLA